MASHKAAAFAFLLILSITHPSSSSSADSHKVNLSIYYESLCPYCANFISNNLNKIFENGIISIVNLRLIPWGNAYMKDNYTWVCQHGPDECMLNTVEACAINVWPDRGAHYNFRFIKCVEGLHLQNKHNEWKNCFGSEKLDSKPVLDCFNSGHGFQLERGYADETTHLDPPHLFVPWLVVDNLPLKDDYQNFIAYVCRAYRGNAIPKACNSNQPATFVNSFGRRNTKSPSQVSFPIEAATKEYSATP
ncbi:gamma-interferon-responsive lysosomal thiol protein-like [Impatiens glandulifera]|uniref:gamma-interferon-responsive lysosomal thiol protein-like n=1 Tax=Impatiens glandulifera TaxID=253017 RepID=UPI001FB16279|nr:gamma-interferon-responsive lysosomal thiol protein-like [Impatiens glandulifera]